jgi:hypothetical protein
MTNSGNFQVWSVSLGVGAARDGARLITAGTATEAMPEGCMGVLHLVCSSSGWQDLALIQLTSRAMALQTVNGVICPSSTGADTTG